MRPRPDVYGIRRSTTTISDMVVGPQQTTVHETTVTQVETVPVVPVVPTTEQKTTRRYAPVPEKTAPTAEATPDEEPQQEEFVAPQQVAQSAKKRAKVSLWRRIRGFDRRNMVSGGLVAVLLLATGYVTIDTWLTNNRVKAELSTSVPTSDEPEDRQAAEGRDESDLPTDFLASYAVAPDLPRALYISKLNIAARVLPMGVNPDNSMQAPINIFDSGWYTGSAKPGTAGAAVIDAHASGPTREGLFAYLNTLVAGDTLEVERGDGTRLSYRVVHIETVPLDDVDMSKVLLPYGSATEGLNLITCDGEWLQGSATYDHRTIVYTERVS